MPVPPLATASVPASVIVPDVVIGEPVTVRPVVPPLKATLVTEPDPVPTPTPLMNRPVALIVPTPCAPPVGAPTRRPLAGFRDVMSVFAPLAAAPRLVRAPAAAVAPVPPCVTVRAVVRPVIDVMSLFAPLAAAAMAVRAAAVVAAVNTVEPMPVAPRLVRADAAEVAPVPPCAMGRTPAKGADVVAGTMPVPSQYRMAVAFWLMFVTLALPAARRPRVNGPVVELFTQYCCTVAGTTMTEFEVSVPVNL